jgi:hypothetical protein
MVSLRGVGIDEAHDLGGRGSSSPAKKLAAALRISWRQTERLVKEWSVVVVTQGNSSPHPSPMIQQPNCLTGG